MINMRVNGKWNISLLSTVFVVCYVVMSFIWIGLHKDVYQWDFNTYYFATKAFVNGANPYDLNILSQYSPRPVELAFVYPPIFLAIFSILGKLDYGAAFNIFLILKLISLLGLFAIWRKGFIEGGTTLIFYLFCIFSFNAAIFKDIYAGNISIFEQSLLWLGFYFLKNKRAAAFCVVTVAVSVFKLAPILFLVLILLTDIPRRKLYFILSGAVFCGIMFLSYMVEPSLFRAFIGNLIGLRERGIVNPSSYALISECFSVILNRPVFAGFSAMTGIFYSVFLGVVIYLAVKAISRLRSTKGRDHGDMIILFICVVYTIILPRFKDYSFIIMIVPAYVMIKKLFARSGYYGYLILMMLIIPAGAAPVGMDLIIKALWRYYPLIISYGVFFCFIYYFRNCANVGQRG